MAANKENLYLLQMFAVPEFRPAAAEAAVQMEDSERFLCAGFTELVFTATDRPAEPWPSPYYLVTSAGLHVGLLLKKSGRFSKASSRNVFIPRDAVAVLLTDHESAVDLRSAHDDPLAFLRFSEGLLQFYRPANDPSPINPGYSGRFSARAQMQNFADSFGLPLSS
jgi:hypothetical protein